MDRLDDLEYTEHTLDRVERAQDGWAVSYGSTSFFCPDVGIEPRVGDVARFYGRGLGYPVRGLVINDKVIFYRTPEEQEEKQRQDAIAAKAARKAEFERNREDLNRRVAALPEPFQARIARFRQRNPEFRWEFESYEVFCCEQAVMIAHELKTLPSIKNFKDLDPKEQYRLLPNLSHDHSGNTFGASVYLAEAYLDAPRFLPFHHGALATLVGCENYGCHPLSEEEKRTLNDDESITLSFLQGLKSSSQ